MNFGAKQARDIFHLSTWTATPLQWSEIFSEKIKQSHLFVCNWGSPIYFGRVQTRKLCQSALVGVIISQAWYFGLSILVTVHTHQLITLGLKSKLEMADFGFEILGFKPRNFLGFEAK